MIVFTVHEPPDAPVDRVDRADRLRFIGDRFSPTAAGFAPFWLLANRIWLGFATYLAACAVIAVSVFFAGLGPRWIPLLLGALNLIVGFEAASLQRMTLERRGWRTLGTVAGRNVDECERRFLESWLPDQHMNSGASAVTTPAPITAMADGSADDRLGRRSGRRWLPWGARGSAT